MTAGVRLEQQARRARQAFPQLTADWDTPPAVEPSQPTIEETNASEEADAAISLAALESDIEQTSDTLELLERIASI